MEKQELALEILHSTSVQDLVRDKGRLVEVPYTATVGDTLNVLLAKNILAVPVAAPPGHWIGAGGSMVVESDKSSGVPRKQYIGMVSVLDILIHVAEREDGSCERLQTAISKIIGHSLEGLSLWSIAPHTSLADTMEPMSKGIHRALVPVSSAMDHVSGVELVESSPGYHMLTQTDVMAFLLVHSQQLEPLMSTDIGSLGAVNKNVYAAPADMRVMDAVRAMRFAFLTAVAIVDPSPVAQLATQLVAGDGRRLLGTFSASDLRGCNSDVLTKWASLSVLEFSHKAFLARRFGFGAACIEAVDQTAASLDPQQKPLITCQPSASLREVISKALENRVHQLWVVDDAGSLLGMVAFTDILKAVRQASKRQ
ncbi:hypothetical protein SELMODRAFT_233423 [Selaginella moellendorffii]|uniref:CBS domain-containing protein n=1 Tax=Selaginella moellendorffii TaxID=88036 RepID=D8S8X1_SELML|nr:SNF1-related protein kinase regulatory subunit gamma-like PV42b [Selaginella moellendorffii]EFJ19242.1 hypothetical protein SELMODRAFT_233423 [Selaginella moellendorffii]|eukprot:XP_002979840.1 SNF1-related protein kinase regulatory subunit gamma-like PV42b [Selaginella moellendorffii]